MSNKKFIAAILAIFGVLLLPDSLGTPITCNIFGNYGFECPTDILIPSVIIGLTFVSIAIFLLLKADALS